MKFNHAAAWVFSLLVYIRQAEPFIPHPALTNKNMPQVAQERIWRKEQTLLMVSPGTLSFPKLISSLWRPENVQKCAGLWNLDPENTMKLYELKHRLGDIIHPKNDPFEIVRFLQENKGNVNASERSIRKMINWRIQNNVDILLEDYRPPSLYRYFPAAVLRGVDRDGDPIHIERTGAADTNGLLERYGRDEMIKYATWIREVQSNGVWQQDYEKSQGHLVKQFTVIFDMKGLGIKKISPSLMSVGQEVSRLVQDYYPNYAKKIIFIRTPAIFQMAWNIFRPFVHKNMQDLMLFSTEKNYLQVLEKYIDPKVLPSVIHPLGEGTAVDDFDLIWEGGPIPDHEEPPCFVAKTKDVKFETHVPPAPQQIHPHPMTTDNILYEIKSGCGDTHDQTQTRLIGRLVHWACHVWSQQIEKFTLGYI